MAKEEWDLHHQFIELMAYWQGKVNTTDLSQQFTISRQMAQKYLSVYQRQCPGNLYYDASVKACLPSNDFTLNYISGDVAQYLDWLDQHKVADDLVNASKVALTNASLSLPSRDVSPKVMRGLVNAIQQHKRIEVDYVSLTNPNREGRIIQPHVFVKTGLRWHLRAYCEKHQTFRDFVLSRFRGEPELLDKATHTGEQDGDWHNLINIVLAPDSRLSAAQKAVLEQDYRMHNGQLIIQTRAALAQYLLQEMQVNFKFHDKSPEAQQLILVNESDIKPWLFNA
jgi:hypothetical protein